MVVRSLWPVSSITSLPPLTRLDFIFVKFIQKITRSKYFKSSANNHIDRVMCDMVTAVKVREKKTRGQASCKSYLNLITSS